MQVEVGASLDLGNNDWRKSTVTLDKEDLDDLCREMSLPTSLLTLDERFGLLRTKAEIMLFKEMDRLGMNAAKDELARSEQTMKVFIAKLSAKTGD